MRAIVVFHSRRGRTLHVAYDVCDGCECVLNKCIEHDSFLDELNNCSPDSKRKILCAIRGYELYDTRWLIPDVIDIDSCECMLKVPDIIVCDGVNMKRL